MIAAPDARSSSYESQRPPEVKRLPKRIARSIIFLRSWVNRLAVAAGIVSRAMTRIVPTTRISTTTVKAIRHKRRK
ncbi:MAG: hypothetical protein DDT24_00531 [Chloroflexi bacterium]|nr:hypothetical protein [Chloroflexota bacterium]